LDVDQLLPTVALWRCTPALIIALDAQLGEPTDTYVNGSQVWLRDDGPGEITLEWRLHPVGGYRRPAATSTTNVFRRIATGLTQPSGAEAVAIAAPESLWGGLEVFSAYEEPLDAEDLRACCVALLGIEPDAVGTVDHDPIADEWERTAGASDIFSALIAQLGR
jgi:hypothetical protein